MQLFLMKDEHVIQALSSHTAQEAFTDRIGSWRVIGRFEYLDAARRCDSSEIGPKLAIMITNEVFGRLSIRSRLPQLLCYPGIGRRSRHTDVDDFPRSQFDDEEGKERAEEEVCHLEEITGPDLPHMTAQEGSPVLSS